MTQWVLNDASRHLSGVLNCLGLKTPDQDSKGKHLSGVLNCLGLETRDQDSKGKAKTKTVKVLSWKCLETPVAAE